MVSYCHQPMSGVRRQSPVVRRESSVVRRPSSVVRRQQLLQTTSPPKLLSQPRALIFGMQHCLVDLYQVCSNGGPGVQNGPGAGGLGFKNKIFLKIFFSRTAWLRCLKFGM